MLLPDIAGGLNLLRGGSWRLLLFLRNLADGILIYGNARLLAPRIDSFTHIVALMNSELHIFNNSIRLGCRANLCGLWAALGELSGEVVNLSLLLSD